MSGSATAIAVASDNAASASLCDDGEASPISNKTTDGAAPARSSASSWAERRALYVEGYTRRIAKSPCCAMWLSLLTLLFLSGISGTVFKQATPGEHTWDISSARNVQLNDAVNEAQNDVDPIGGASRNVSARVYSHSDVFVTWYFESRDGGDIFAPTSVQQMCQVEAMMILDPRYADFCVLNATTEDGACEWPALTVSGLYYGEGHDYSCGLLAESAVGEVSDMMYASLEEGDVNYGMYDFYMASNAGAGGSTSITRSLVYLGSPLEGYTSQSDKQKEQMDLYVDFLTDVETALFDLFDMKEREFPPFSAYRVNDGIAETSELEVRFWSFGFQQNQFETIVQSDMFLAVFSIMFVFVWIWVHVGSLFLASIGILQIILSLPVGYFFYRLVFQITFYETLQSLTIFLVLGIGADDIFVFVDGWRQSGVEFKDDAGQVHIGPSGKPMSIVHRRLHFAFLRTAQAVFNTSFTTAMAFVATSISPIMPISTFGAFAAICIVVNYAIVITLTPAAVVVWHRYFRGCTARSLCTSEGRARRRAEKRPSLAGVFAEENAEEGPGLELASPPSSNGGVFTERKVSPGPLAPAALCEKDGGSATRSVRAKQDSLATDKAKRAASGLPSHDGLGDLFMRSCYIPFISYSWNRLQICGHIFFDGRRLKVMAWFSIALWFAIGIQGLFYALKLTPPTRMEEWFPPDHMFTGLLDDLANDFLGGADSQYEQVEIVWGIEGIDREADGYDQYYPEDNLGIPIFDDAFDLSDPDAQQSVLDACETIREYQCSADGCSGSSGLLVRQGSLQCFMEDFVGWNAAAYPGSSSTLDLDSDTFYDRLEEFRDVSYVYKDSIGFITTDEGVRELKFVLVTFTSTLKLLMPSATKNGVLQTCDALVADLSAVAPPSAATIIQVAGYAWVWFHTETGLVDGMFLGLVITIPIAYATLLISTRNFITSTYALLSIVFIVANVLGFCESVLDWDLGIAESIAAVIVVGFSVDYVLHLGHVYGDARKDGFASREDRFSHAAMVMGTTVLAGAVTTGGSGLFMLGCQLTFFTKMAVLISSTIFFSFMYSLMFFMPLLFCAGPSGNQGEIGVMLGWEPAIEFVVVAEEEGSPP